MRSLFLTIKGDYKMTLDRIILISLKIICTVAGTILAKKVWAEAIKKAKAKAENER
jgi:hypothetical protein